MNAMDIASLEDINLQTWQAPWVGERHGWRLMFSGGYSRRANSVYTHRYQGTNIHADIAYCEHVYALFNATPLFRTTTATQPTSLTEILAARGYQPSAANPVKMKALRDRDTSMTAHSDFEVVNTVSDEWLQHYMRFNQVDTELYDSQKAILLTLPTPVCFARIGTSALGIGVCIDAVVTFYNIVVNPDQRGQGYGRAIMHSLCHWAQEQGATTGVLCVNGTNTIAQQLYDSLGFQSQYTYTYWSKPTLDHDV